MVSISKYIFVKVFHLSSARAYIWTICISIYLLVPPINNFRAHNQQKRIIKPENASIYGMPSRHIQNKNEKYVKKPNCYQLKFVHFALKKITTITSLDAKKTSLTYRFAFMNLILVVLWIVNNLETVHKNRSIENKLQPRIR